MNRVSRLLFAGAVMLSMAQSRRPDPLSEARRLYNEQRYDEAIKSAEAARLVPSTTPAATVVFARAHLERYRISSAPMDLTVARDVLKGVDVTALGARDRVEFAIAVGEAIYLDDQYVFDDRYSAAAEQFEVALGGADLLDDKGRDLLFEWWALSLDRQAQLGPESERRPAYQRIVTRAEQELARDPGAPSASYWLAAGARGIDDFPRAWGAAASAWIRAASMGARGAALREDLDRLIVQVILPERAKQLAAGEDARPTLASLISQWEQVKDRWK